MSRYMKGLAIHDKAGPSPIAASRLHDTAAPDLPPASHVGLDRAPPTTTSGSTVETTPQRAPPVTTLSTRHQSGVVDSGVADSAGTADSRLPPHSTSSSSSSSASSNTSTQQQSSATTTDQQQQPATALNSVVLPALEAALHRRSYNLSLLSKQIAATAATTPSSEQQQHDLLLKRQAHEQIRKCMAKVSRLFREIDHWDGVAPVRMGEGVEGVLEGFLEEILCRVEAEDA